MPLRPSSKVTSVAMSASLRAVVERVDQRRVALGDEAAAHLARARQLAVVGVELLVQDQEAPDLRARHRRARSASARFTSSTCFGDQVVDLRLAGQLLVGAIDDVVALGPVADRGEVDVDACARRSRGRRRRPPPP